MTEQETIGDWAGRVPTPNDDEALQAETDHDLARKHRQLINFGIRSLIQLSGENSRDHGFHDDWPVEGYPTVTTTGLPASDVSQERIDEYKAQLRRAIVEKLDLVHEEVSESLGEVRSGHDPLEIYYSIRIKLDTYADTLSRYEIRTFPEQEYELVDDAFPGGPSKPSLKPEGFLVELADAMIRIADLVYLVGGEKEFIRALNEKHEYNSTRPFKHGRKF